MRFEATVDGRAVSVEVRERQGRYTVVLDGRVHEVDWHELGPQVAHLLVGGHSHDVALARRPGGFEVGVGGRNVAVEVAEAAAGGGAGPRRTASGRARVTAPMPGRIVRVLVEPEATVAAGDPLVVMEAMKMENELAAPRAGRVKEVAVTERQAVETGALLVVLE